MFWTLSKCVVAVVAAASAPMALRLAPVPRSSSLAHQSTGSPAVADSVPPWMTFFAGDWDCAGAFSNGRSIAADVSFAPRLDGKWLEYRHTDRAPGRYKVIGYIGTDAATGNVLATMHDNGGGARLFISPPWGDSALLLENAPLLRPPRGHERFVFRRQSPSTFHFAWEVMRDSATGWHLGDSLRCVRKQS
jgi:hypothetical protein